MKTPLIGILFFFLFCSIFALMVTLIFSKIEEQETEMKSHVGEEIIIQNDTLIILSYSLLNEEYSLSNGATISAELIK